ncbi:Pterin-4-alpha-carbinolamine dehydratase [Acidisarcina polymorpha]|uniref:Putative pterin-4-alpha-carbinolamine dehydratase n=1 Tax=Acidisarcina polymorpha TaxID=2211140 RepID=A0A2Z5G3H7_9BACT|nr:4a-hydroxytetrahydrobiopterin dehydratase [Acidisarcina polymorpha]AXC13658.1 Pterin-4-alpha-carbinolamine dehydratase [Acidisarcina polymorpha]
MTQLTDAEVAEELTRLPEWRLVGAEIVRDLTFADFNAAMAFVNRVAEKAESAGHHPDIDIRWNRVKLALVSHDAGGLTDRDFELALDIDSLA